MLPYYSKCWSLLTNNSLLVFHFPGLSFDSSSSVLFIIYTNALLQYVILCWDICSWFVNISLQANFSIRIRYTAWFHFTRVLICFIVYTTQTYIYNTNWSDTTKTDLYNTNWSDTTQTDLYNTNWSLQHESIWYSMNWSDTTQTDLYNINWSIQHKLI